MRSGAAAGVVCLWACLSFYSGSESQLDAVETRDRGRAIRTSNQVFILRVGILSLFCVNLMKTLLNYQYSTVRFHHVLQFNVGFSFCCNVLLSAVDIS